jgi:hypothetical protein
MCKPSNKHENLSHDLENHSQLSILLSSVNCVTRRFIKVLFRLSWNIDKLHDLTRESLDLIGELSGNLTVRQESQNSKTKISNY